jgi:hypothetical protein
MSGPEKVEHILITKGREETTTTVGKTAHILNRVDNVPKDEEETTTGLLVKLTSKTLQMSPRLPMILTRSPHAVGEVVRDLVEMHTTGVPDGYATQGMAYGPSYLSDSIVLCVATEDGLFHDVCHDARVLRCVGRTVPKFLAYEARSI